MKLTEEDTKECIFHAQRIANTCLKYISFLGGKNTKGIYLRQNILEEIIKILNAKV